MRKGKRKYVLIATAVVMLAVLAAVCLTACNNGAELPQGRPVSWETYLEEAADAVAEKIRLEGGELGIKFTADSASEDGLTELLLGLNYDFGGIDKSLMVLRLSVRGENVFSLVSDNSSTFLDIAPNDAIDDAKLKIENLNIFDFFKTAWNPEGQDVVIAAFKEMLINLGRTFFDEVDVDASGSRYVFKIADDFKNTGKQYFNRVMGAFGDTVSSAVLGAFRIDSVDELFSALPDISGSIALEIDDDGISLSADELIVDGNASRFEADGAAQYALYDEFYAYVPDDEASYVHTKLGSTYMAGTVTAYDGDEKAASYDYELNANIDLMSLMLSGSDLAALPEDNYFHFRVSHRCGRRCTDFCEGKLSEARGAVLDIAFSPSDFGSDHVFVSLNLHSLVTSDYLDEVSAEVGGLGVNTVPEYVLFSYPAESFREGSALYDVFMTLYVNNLFKHGETEWDGTFASDGDGIISVMFGQYASSGGYDVDRMVFDIKTNDYGRAEKYDIYKQTVYIIADDVSDLKDYGTDLPLLGYEYVTVLDWRYEAPARTSDGLVLSNIYDEAGNLVHGADADGRYVPMSPEEASSLTDCYLLAECTGIDKVTQKKFYARIIGVESLDLSERGVQEIKLSVSYPNPLYSSSVNELFAGMADDLHTEVRASVKLTDYASGGEPKLEACDSRDNYGKKFYIEYRSDEAPEFLRARASVEYANGYVKTMDIIGTSDAVVMSGNRIFDYRYYSTVECGDIEVRFDYFNRTSTRTYRVEEPDDVSVDIRQDRIGPYEVGESVYLSSITVYIDAVVRYDNAPEGVREVELMLRPRDFSINGITIDRPSTNWTSRLLSEGSCVLVFRNSADYVCTLDVLGRKYAFVMKVLPSHAQPPEFAFSATGELPPYSFTDVKYIFRGQIVNSVHGETQDVSERMYEFSVNVYKGSVNQYGNLVFYLAPSDSYTLSDFEVHYVKADGDSVYTEVPDMLTSPWNVYFGLTFASAGYYRVEFVMDGDVYNLTRYYWYLNVDDLSNG